MALGCFHVNKFGASEEVGLPRGICGGRFNKEEVVPK
jgi:hypothetical protein